MRLRLAPSESLSDLMVLQSFCPIDRAWVNALICGVYDVERGGKGVEFFLCKRWYVVEERWLWFYALSPHRFSVFVPYNILS